MSDFFNAKFLNNNVFDWLIALLVIVGSIIIAKLVYWIIGKFVKKLTAKTKTKLDDIIVDMVEEPIVFAIVIFGIWISLNKLLVFPEGINTFIDKVYIILIAINVTWLIARLFDSLVEEYLVPMVTKSDSDLDDQLLPIARKGIKFTIWTIGIIVSMDKIGYDVGALIAGLGIGGIAFAMAAKDSVSNLFGGFTIFADKPFTINDRIQIDGFDGTVKEIGIRSTRLQTLAGRTVTIPNSHFTSKSIENVTSEPHRKISTSFSLTLDTDSQGLELAMNIIKEVIANHKSTKEDIYIGFTEVNEYAFKIIAIYYVIKGENILGTQTEINIEIVKQFTESNLKFAKKIFPTS